MDAPSHANNYIPVPLAQCYWPQASWACHRYNYARSKEIKTGRPMYEIARGVLSSWNGRICRNKPPSPSPTLGWFLITSMKFKSLLWPSLYQLGIYVKSTAKLVEAKRARWSKWYKYIDVITSYKLMNTGSMHEKVSRCGQISMVTLRPRCGQISMVTPSFNDTK